MNTSGQFSISNEDCEKLAHKIKTEIYEPVIGFKRSVFLCGADVHQPGKLRSQIAETLIHKWYAHYFDLIFPEVIFDDLLYSSNSKDLLSLENLLADSVDAVVIIPESPGSFTELGAFVNSEKLRKRVVCVLDRRYKKDKSFINRGPLKLIKESHRERVLFINPDNVETEVDKLRTVLFSMDRPKDRGIVKINLLQIENFVLPAIYLLEPVSRDTLVKLVEYASNDVENGYPITVTALTSLSKQRHVELTGSGYKLTKLGIESYIRIRKQGSRSKTQPKTNLLDKIRLDILNYSLRGKKLQV